MADGTNVVEPLSWEGIDPTNTKITTVDSVEIDFGGGDVRDRQRIIVKAGDARTTWGEAVSVQPGATATVATLVGAAKLRLLGFSATGTGDARFRLLVNDAPLLGGSISINERNIERALLVGILLPLNSTATVQVLCRGTQASDYEATIYAEVSDG